MSRRDARSASDLAHGRRTENAGLRGVLLRVVSQLAAVQCDLLIHKVVLLREEGSGRPYTHPGASTPTEGAEGDYFILPHLYWHAGWYGQMDLATRVVLLIALSRPPGEFILPIEHAANWYGFSAESMRHGLKTLQLLGLLEHRTLTFPAPLSRLGYRTERCYRLSGPLAGYYDRDSADAVIDAQGEDERPA